MTKIQPVAYVAIAFTVNDTRSVSQTVSRVEVMIDFSNRSGWYPYPLDIIPLRYRWKRTKATTGYYYPCDGVVLGDDSWRTKSWCSVVVLSEAELDSPHSTRLDARSEE